MTQQRIAIVGIGLRYPDAATPEELWTNVVAGRRAFRTLPQERTNLADYWDPDPAVPDKFYASKAAVLRDYEFDRVGRMISTRTMASTDMTHWLALDVAADALTSAGFADGQGLPRDRTTVVLGNTLTGEFSRANVMRLRWPYVRRTVSALLADRDWQTADIDTFVRDLEGAYKKPFPAVNEDTLAGGLANTIAGRVCNYFDLGGGGYTVDGACSSSLLSVINAANALRSGDADVALAGGVDLSIDPFELVGFAKTGALAKGEMVVYDRDANGFWPGEGCGMVVLMRESDARAQDRPIIATLTGWGFSSDGKGGITRPEVGGHRRAITNAYTRAGYHPSTVSYFEGHGTGTAVGDATEIAALASTRDGVDDPWPAALSSVKANIGHTKAAAGVAGLIKAALSVHHRVVPPATGFINPHPLLGEKDHAIKVPTGVEDYHQGVPVRAGVSAMGFGGINTHIALEADDPSPTAGTKVSPALVDVVTGRQDAELLLLAADTAEALTEALTEVAGTLERAAMCELTDLAVHLQKEPLRGEHRVAVVARNPADAVARLKRVVDFLAEHDGPARLARVDEGTWYGHGLTPGRVAFAFPGQGAGHGRSGEVIRRFGGPADGDDEAGSAVGTAGLQPRVVRRSLQGLAALTSVGVQAETAIGHSLGEITALAWAGALTAEDAHDLARVRGRAMYERVPRNGAMVVVGAGPEQTRDLLDGTEAEISGYNAPRLTVVAGSRTSVDAVIDAATSRGFDVTPLDVEHAFHTSHCRVAADEIAHHVAGLAWQLVGKDVVSPALGAKLDAQADLRTFLVEQITNPVRFSEATRLLAGHDLVIEVGPGRTLSGLVSSNLPDVPSATIDTDARTLVPFLDTVGAAYALGQPVQGAVLAQGRAHRQFAPGQQMSFLSNPCEAAPDLTFVPTEFDNGETSGQDSSSTDGASTLEVLLGIVAEKVDLPVSVLGPHTSPLDDLHLSSITVGQITNDVVRALGRGPLSGVPSFATSTLGDIASMIDEMADAGDDAKKVVGAGPWIRTFVPQSTVEALLPAPAYGQARDWVRVGPADAVSDVVVGKVSRLPGLEPGLVVTTTGAGPQEGADVIENVLDVFKNTNRATPLVVLQRGDFGVAAAARSLFLEGVSKQITVIHLPENLALVTGEMADSIAAEVARNEGFVEVTYTTEGTRVHQSWAAAQTGQAEKMTSYLGAEDVLLVTGGGKGITAEAALRIAQHSGCGLILMGRADTSDADVSATLERARRARVKHAYVSADVTDVSDVIRAVRTGESAVGQVTGILHGAGTNEPVRAVDLTRAQLDRTVATKVAGLRNAVAAVDTSRLRLVLAFGSIIGRAGLDGEVHYATANDWLSEEVLAIGQAHPHVRARSIEWSVWSGAGMGERLGVLESLQQRGIEPVPSEWGVALVTTLIDDPDLPGVVVVAGRTGSFATMRHTVGDLPLLRFLEKPQIHYAGVELIVDAELSAGTDLYLPDHVLDGEMIFPAVMGMEAMSQAAVTLQPDLRDGLAFRDLVFERPVIVPAGGSETIRVAALVDGDTVRVVIRTSSTGFAVDHYRAVISRPPAVDLPPGPESNGLLPLALEPGRDLYGSLMFQGSRFQNVRNYRVALARKAVAELDTTPRHAWFSIVHPHELVLAAPGARDAMMHAIQCCVPDAVLLPEGVDLLVPAMATYDGPCVLMEAHEADHDGDQYTYGLMCFDENGHVERWEGLRLRAVKRRSPRSLRWSPAMTGPYLQRRSEEVFGRAVEVVVEPHLVGTATGRPDHRAATERAIARLRPTVGLHRRGDGRLLLDANTNGCSSHHDQFTLAVVSPDTVACDTEAVVERPDRTWQNLLGDQWALAREIATATGSDVHEAATRVWGAMECVRKAGHSSIGLSLASATDDSVVITAGPYRVVTWVLPTGDTDSSTMFALLGGH